MRVIIKNISISGSSSVKGRERNKRDEPKREKKYYVEGLEH